MESESPLMRAVVRGIAQPDGSGFTEQSRADSAERRSASLIYIPANWKILSEMAMSPPSEMLKTTEAAVVSRVALRDVNRAIDDAEKVELATIFAEAYPPRGRPRSGGELPKGAVIISDRRVPRRKKAK